MLGKLGGRDGRWDDARGWDVSSEGHLGRVVRECPGRGGGERGWRRPATRTTLGGPTEHAELLVYGQTITLPTHKSSRAVLFLPALPLASHRFSGLTPQAPHWGWQNLFQDNREACARWSDERNDAVWAVEAGDGRVRAFKAVSRRRLGLWRGLRLVDSFKDGLEGRQRRRNYSSGGKTGSDLASSLQPLFLRPFLALLLPLFLRLHTLRRRQTECRKLPTKGAGDTEIPLEFPFARSSRRLAALPPRLSSCASSPPSYISSLLSNVSPICTGRQRAKAASTRGIHIFTAGTLAVFSSHLKPMDVG